MKKKDKSAGPATNPILSHAISMIFDLAKHWLKDLENTRKVNKIDKFSEQFGTLENLVIKIDRRAQENGKLIEKLKLQLLWSNIVIILLLVVSVLQLFLG
ncbi:MAG: hypothetical protein K8R90_08165 [Candidatus Cloacimonetes bacterium]|nr:hypothetical protein [Candidatus Cloacimonadota bacterium]